MTDFDRGSNARSRLGVGVDETCSPFTVVGLSGELDLESSPQVRDLALDLLRRGRNRLVVDLTAVRFIDSIGLGVLMLILKRVEATRGDLSLVCDNGDVMRVFEASGLSTVFRITGTLGEATGRAA